jgi:NDP-sugar pyrophosphorylase family protein
VVEIAGRLMLWRIMNFHARHGIKVVVAACGNKGDVIEKCF